MDIILPCPDDYPVWLLCPSSKHSLLFLLARLALSRACRSGAAWVPTEKSAWVLPDKSQKCVLKSIVWKSFLWKLQEQEVCEKQTQS